MSVNAIRVASLLALAGAAMWLFAGGIELRSDLSFVLPEKISPRTQFLAQRLTDRKAQGVLMLGISGGAAEGRQDASMRLTASLNETGLFESVVNGGGASLPDGFAALFDNRYLLGPFWEPEKEFTSENIHTKLAESLELLGTSAGPFVTRYLPADPTDRGRRVLESVAPMIPPLREGGIWVTGDRQMALIAAHANLQAYDLEAQSELIRTVETSFASVAQGSKLELSVSGPAQFGIATRDRIESNVAVLSVFSMLLILLLAWAGFRRPALPLLLALPMGIGLFAGLLAVQAVFGHVHGITLAFGACLVGIAIDYPLHILVHAVNEESTESAARNIWPTLRLSALSTAVAFIPFILADFPGLSQIGLFVVSGLIAGLLAARYLFPPLCSSPDTTPIAGSLLMRLWRARGYMRWPLATLAVAGAVAIALRWDTVWEADLQALSPAPAELVLLDRKLRTGLGVPDVRYIISVNGTTTDEVLEREEQLRPILESAKGEGALEAWRMAADYLPSIAEQTRRRDALPGEDNLRSALSVAVEGTLFRVAAFEPFIADVARAREMQPVSADNLPESISASLVDPYLTKRNDGWTGTVLLSGVARPVDLTALLQAASVEGIELLDLKAEANLLIRSFVEESLLWLGASLAVVFAMLYAGLRRFRAVFQIMGSVAIAIIGAAGLLAALGISLSLFHILSLILVAGLGMDYGLFMARRDGDDITTLRATILCNLTTASVFLVMAFSTIPVLHGIGMTVSVGSFLALAANAAFADRAAA